MSAVQDGNAGPGVGPRPCPAQEGITHLLQNTFPFAPELRVRPRAWPWGHPAVPRPRLFSMSLGPSDPPGPSVAWAPQQFVTRWKECVRGRAGASSFLQLRVPAGCRGPFSRQPIVVWGGSAAQATPQLKVDGACCLRPPAATQKGSRPASAYVGTMHGPAQGRQTPAASEPH